MEVDRIQTTKFQRICYNNNGSSHDTSSNPNKIGTDGVTDTNGANNEFIRGPLSRIVRVSRSSGGKDRHSKVLTSKGLRDRRVRLSVSTAIQFYDLQDRLGYDQPSKAVEWLIKAAANSIDELPSLDPCFNHHVNDITNNNNNSINNEYKVSVASKSSACSSTTETSKGSGLSLARSENRVRARERARELAAKKEKEKGSSVTDLLMGGLNSTTVSPNNNSNHENSPESTNHMNYFQMPQFNVLIGENCKEEQQQQQRHHEYAFVQENMNFVQGLNRGTLQSNVVSNLPHNMNQLQRFHHQPMVDGSMNYPIYMAANMGAHEQFQAAGYDSQCLQLYGGGRNSNHHKERSKN